jgi:choline dehydrogenase-like flavoprotein
VILSLGVKPHEAAGIHRTSRQRFSHALGGLRVFDPSIMLTITSAYTNATTIMIAENAADMICADRGSDLVAISTSA